MRYQKLQHVFECCLSALQSPTVVLTLVYCPVDDDTLFEVGSEIRYSDMSSRCCCYGNHTAGSKLGFFIVVNGELNEVCLRQNN